MKLYLPALQAAAALAAATPKEKAPLRLIHINHRPGGGQQYRATCDGKLAVCVEHPCTQEVSGTAVAGGGPINGTVPIAGTELDREKTLLVWADSVPGKKPTKAEAIAGCWIDPEEAGLVVWRINIDSREVRLGSDGPKLPGEENLSTLLGVPTLSQLLREFIPGNYFPGHPGRFNATYLALLAKAAELVARGANVTSRSGPMLGDTPSLEFYCELLREGAHGLVDLTAQRRWEEGAMPTAWGLLMPIHRREGGPGKKLMEAPANA